MFYVNKYTNKENYFIAFKKINMYNKDNLKKE